MMTFALIDLDKRYLSPHTTQRDAVAVCEACIAEAKTWRENKETRRD